MTAQNIFTTPIEQGSKKHVDNWLACMIEPNPFFLSIDWIFEENLQKWLKIFGVDSFTDGFCSSFYFCFLIQSREFSSK